MTPDQIGRENSFTTSPLDSRDQFGRLHVHPGLRSFFVPLRRQFITSWQAWRNRVGPCWWKQKVGRGVLTSPERHRTSATGVWAPRCEMELVNLERNQNQYCRSDQTKVPGVISMN